MTSKLTVGKLRKLMSGLPDTALVLPDWASPDDVPSDCDPGVELVGFEKALEKKRPYLSCEFGCSTSKTNAAPRHASPSAAQFAHAARRASECGERGVGIRSPDSKEDVMDEKTELLLQKAAQAQQWEHEERGSYDLETLREEFRRRLYPPETRESQNGAPDPG